MSKQNILVLASSYPKRSGDVNGVFVHGLCNKLTDSFNVFVIAPWEDGIAKEEVLDGVSVIRHRQFLWNVNFAYGTDIMTKLGQNPLLYMVVPFFLLFQLLLIRRVVAQHGIKLIHAHWLMPSAFVAAMYRTLFNRDIRIITTLLGADVWSFNAGWKKHLLKFTFYRIDAVTAQSAPLLEEVVRLGYRGKAIVLPIGIDTKKFTPEHYDSTIRQQYGISGMFLLFVGSLITRKGVIPLVNAMALLRRSHKDFKLLMVGAGDQDYELRELIARHGLQDHVVLTGNIPNTELPRYFATSDIFVLPSLSEGFPLVVMEALSSGTLPVVSDISVFTAHEHREQLFTIVKAGDAMSVANALARILDDRERLDEQKIHLRNYAKEHMDISIIAKRYKIIIQNLLE